MLALLSSIAHGRPADCPDLYLVQFERFFDEVDALIVAQEFSDARRMLDGAYPRVPCIVQVVPSVDLAKYAIRRSYLYALDLDENETLRWATTAKALEPGIDWPAYVPPEHSVRALLPTLEVPAPVPIEGAGLVVPERGGVFLDGRFLTVPQAEPELPHLLQVGDGMGRMVASRWQDGTMFPDDLLGPPLEQVPEPPRWFTHPNAKIRPPKEPRPWTAARKTRLESAAGFAVAGGALFGTAWVARWAYDQRATDGLYYTVNGATVASGAAGGAAVVLLGAAVFGK
ncbi:MAG: hypothetical protein ABMA64_24920 [Myxococcota bacterium]